jgi:catechol 2,3-dioxygenase-like lactoylglutathione lyase family enzyme
MFDHVTIRASNLSVSAGFYRTVLGVLGIAATHAGPELIEWDDFSIVGAEDRSRVTRNLHVGFVAPSRDAVDSFWQAGTRAGFRSLGEPGERPQYTQGYYGGFLSDPDGNSAEAVHHEDVRRGGHIDHLWIGVADLERPVAFYELISPHAGLRSGRSWPAGRQFRGAWATFSLVADGREPTENLHLAFPAPDRTVVEELHRAATEAGHPDDGPPGERPRYHPGYYSAYVRGPEGTSVESVLHGLSAERPR